MEGTTVSEAGPRPGPADGGRPIVLCVEDDPLLRLVIARQLVRFGADAVAASGGREALVLLEAGLRPALILTDLDMPGMCGEELLRAVRRIPALAGIPVVAVSGLDTSEDFDALVPKPFSVAELRGVVDAFCPRGLVPQHPVAARE